MDTLAESPLRSVRTAASVLMVVAVVLAVGTLVSSFINATTDLNDLYGGPSVDIPWRVKLGQFLQTAIPNLGWAGLLFAASFALTLGATRQLSAAAGPPDSGEMLFRDDISPAMPTVRNDDLWRRPTTAEDG